MHYLIHGDYHLNSRRLLSSILEQAKEKGKNIFKINGEKADLNEIIQAVGSNSLFGGEKVIVIENLFSRLKSKAQEEILEWIKNYKDENELIFWEKKSIGKILQRRLPANTTVKEFKTPVEIFKLVESISPKRKKQILILLEQIFKSESGEFVMAMMSRQIRLLLMIKGGEMITGAPWMIGKMKKQAEEFSLEQLLTNYEKLYIIDKQIKTGATPMKYDFHLVRWVAEL